MNIKELLAQKSEDEEAFRKIAEAAYKAHLHEASERLRFQTEFSQSALKNLTLVNGAAIIALFTFIGNDNAQFDPNQIRWSFGAYLIGLFFSLFSYFGAYFSQGMYMHVTFFQAWNSQLRMHGLKEKYEIDRQMRIGNVHLYLAVTLALLSLFAFGLGSYWAVEGVL